MSAATLTCEMLTSLRWRWLDGGLSEDDTEAYEQHLLFCPPCLVETDKARASLTALRGVAVTAPAEELVRHLVDRFANPAGGRP